MYGAVASFLCDADANNCVCAKLIVGRCGELMLEHKLVRVLCLLDDVCCLVVCQ